MTKTQRTKLLKTIASDLVFIAIYSIALLGGWPMWTIYVILLALAAGGVATIWHQVYEFAMHVNQASAELSPQLIWWNRLDAFAAPAIMLLSPMPIEAAILFTVIWLGASYYVQRIMVKAYRQIKVDS